MLLTPKAIRERLSDGAPVSEAETQRILDHARRLTLHRKQEELRILLVKHGDSFEPRAREQVRGFLSETAAAFFSHPRVVGDGQVELLGPSPALAEGRGHAHRRVAGPLWAVRGPTANASQGRLGDCFLLASFDASAKARPQIIRDALRDNRDGTYTARFFRPGRLWGSTEEKVTVDGRLPDGYGKSDDPAQPWVGLLEKAFAQFKGGSYQAIADGGRVSETLFALTGKQPSVTRLHGWTSTARLQAQIDFALAAGRPILATTPPSDQPHEVAGPGIHPQHAYAVMERCGNRVVLRNPWGKDGESPRVEVELQELPRVFNRLYVGG
jgi:hypothetical protein